MRDIPRNLFLWIFAGSLDGAHRSRTENEDLSEFIDWSYSSTGIYALPRAAALIAQERYMTRKDRAGCGGCASEQKSLGFHVRSCIFRVISLFLAVCAAAPGGAHRPRTENQNLSEFIGWLHLSTGIYAFPRAVAQIIQEER